MARLSEAARRARSSSGASRPSAVGGIALEIASIRSLEVQGRCRTNAPTRHNRTPSAPTDADANGGAVPHRPRGVRGEGRRLALEQPAESNVRGGRLQELTDDALERLERL